MTENIVIGKPLVELSLLLGENQNDTSFIKNTHFTNERFLPNILKELELVPSNSWVRKNKPKLFIALNTPTVIDLRLGKKKKTYLGCGRGIKL